jgi:hypothetical protein
MMMSSSTPSVLFLPGEEVHGTTSLTRRGHPGSGGYCTHQLTAFLPGEEVHPMTSRTRRGRPESPF